LHTGEPVKADELYQQAQQKLFIKQMCHFAWLELQRGIIDLEQQNNQQALEHYLRAEQAYSGYWLIHEHIAECLYVAGSSRRCD
jgi:tetratricopeptide (TPR) repeat protein